MAENAYYINSYLVLFSFLMILYMLPLLIVNILFYVNIYNNTSNRRNRNNRRIFASEYQKNYPWVKLIYKKILFILIYIMKEILTVKNTIMFSLLVQLITGIVSLHGLFISLPEKDKILTDILGLETFVQFVEFIFYIWISYAVVNVNVMTSRRYIDWVITTPTMLLSTIIFMKYQEEKEKNNLINFWEFIKKNKKNILLIFFYNFAMLAVGFIGEINLISKYITTPIGFYFFYKCFSLVYYNYAIKSKLGIKIFTFMASVWSLYGVAALAPINIKNISYNLLDIIAKNFYGLYLYYKILQIKI